MADKTPEGAIDVGWASLAESAPTGLALVDGNGLFLQVNGAGLALCDRGIDDLVGTPAPFAPALSVIPGGAHASDEAADERTCLWVPDTETRIEFAYRTRSLPNDPAKAVVSFRDVTAERHHQRRVGAIARSSAKLASEGSVTATLDALAGEVLQADALAGVQILIADELGNELRIMGSAGFPRWPDFFERLSECRRRGATLRMIDAFEGLQPVVVPHRRSAMRDDPAWAPLYDYLGLLEWDWFASVPLVIRGRSAGIMNVFFAPGQIVGPPTVEFLEAMAEQAAVAVDYASLLRTERELARREERQRLARDLHDSIVQQVFSIGMQAKSMQVLGSRGGSVPSASVRRIADEVGGLSQLALTDLRAMVDQLRPGASAVLGLAETIRTLVTSTTNRTGLRIDLTLGPELERVPADTADDVYRIVAEAVHNVVKHADATVVGIRIDVLGNIVSLSVVDDGCGLPNARTGRREAGGFGLTTMRERAQRWGGLVRVRRRSGDGTSVKAIIPLPGIVAVGEPEGSDARPTPTDPNRHGPEDEVRAP